MAPLPADMILARMVDLDAFPGVDDLTSLEGQVITDPAFMSTSLGPPVRDAGSEVQMRIAAPEGTPAVITGTLSGAPGQREIVLARGTQLAVTKAVRDGDGNWEMWLMALPGSAVAKAAGDGGAAKDRMGDAVFTIVGKAPKWALKWPGDRQA